MRFKVVVAAAMLAGAAQAPADAQTSIFRQLVGVWNHLQSGHSIDVRPTGDVWSTGSSLARVSSTIQSGANFAFEGTDPDGAAWRCAYYITVLSGNNSANWRLVRRHGRANCPTGIFRRVSWQQG